MVGIRDARRAAGITGWHSSGSRSAGSESAGHPWHCPLQVVLIHTSQPFSGLLPTAPLPTATALSPCSHAAARASHLLEGHNGVAAVGLLKAKLHPRVRAVLPVAAAKEADMQGVLRQTWPAKQHMLPHSSTPTHCVPRAAGHQHALAGSHLMRWMPTVLHTKSSDTHLKRQSMTMRWLGTTSLNTPCTLPPYRLNLPPCIGIWRNARQIKSVKRWRESGAELAALQGVAAWPCSASGRANKSRTLRMQLADTTKRQCRHRPRRQRTLSSVLTG